MIEVDSSKVLDLFEVRKKIDSEGAAMAAERATKEDLERLRKCADELERHIADNRSILDVEPAKLYQKTFFLIADATHNSVYAHFMKSIWTLLEGAIPYSRQKLLAVPNISNKLTRQYRQIVTALMERKPGQAREAVMAHLNFVGDQLGKAIGPSSEES
jgi:DNA-binding FadR family transcriptional regulator